MVQEENRISAESKTLLNLLDLTRIVGSLVFQNNMFVSYTLTIDEYVM